MSPLAIVQYKVNGDQSPSPSPTQHEVATFSSSSIAPKPPRALALPFDAGAGVALRALAKALELAAVGFELEDRLGAVLKPYATPLAGNIEPVEQKSVTWLGSSGSCRMSYSLTRPSEVRTSSTESCSPHGWKRTLAIDGDEGEW